ncbi:hypothetical protein BJX62DRAFT_206045 [Aspergillus germanicus]
MTTSLCPPRAAAIKAFSTSFFRISTPAPASSKRRTVKRWPSAAAVVRALSSLHLMSIPIPNLITTLITSSCPCFAAEKSGVVYRFVVTSLPALINSRNVCTCPFSPIYAATMSG